MVTETAEETVDQSQEIPNQVTQEIVTPEVLQAQLEALAKERDTLKATIETRRKELGDRDKGLARLSAENQSLNIQIADLMDRFEALRVSVHGTEEIPAQDLTGNEAYEAEYQKRKQQRNQTSKNPITPEEVEAIGQMKAIARLHEIDYGAIPAELTQVTNEVTQLYEEKKLKEAIDTWEKGVKAYVADKKSKEEAKKKEEQDLAARKARLMVTDRGSPTGGGEDDYSGLSPRELARRAYSQKK